MSFVTNVTDLATRVSTECKSIRVLLNGNGSDLSALTTTTKTNLVAALNELNAAIAATAAGSGAISDNTTAPTSTWSSQKTADSILAAKNELLGGAGAAYDTLQELKTLLDAGDATDQAAITAINTALGYRLRVDAAQSLTSGQMQQGRDNLNVYSKTEIGDVSANFVTVFESGLL
jgi:hypothetical protein